METNVIIHAEPEPIEINPQRTAVIVIDMQNAFAKKGGMLDLHGMDISGAEKIVGTCKKVIKAARQAGCKIIYTRHVYDSDLSNAGGENSPNWHKELALVLMRKEPDLKGKLLVQGTWDVEIIEDLKPQEGDIVVSKQRYSAFVGTNLDMILKTYDIKHLVFMGIATNVCVDSTLRNAYFLEYFPILISDAVNHVGPDSAHEATMFIVKLVFGWVTDSNNFFRSLGAKT